jgi:proteasome assembly chaperone (PAC2) family protein
MDELIELAEKPVAQGMYMIAGWRQWADAGSISSGLPQYLVEKTRARKIGQFKPDGFYMFQVPGTHQFLRPEIKLEEGHVKELRPNKNELFYSGNDRKGLVIFLGDEPHLNIERYTEAFFNAAQELRVERVAVVGGVYGTVPYNKDRQISCTYSLPSMKDELSEYAVRFSDYEGGASIGSYLADRAEKLGVEYFAYYAVVPMYDLSQLSSLLQGVRIEHDFKAWYDLMRRFNHMFGLRLDLSELERQSEELTASMTTEIDELEKRAPQSSIRDYLDKLAADFDEMPFMPLDVWNRELGDLFKDVE